MKILKLRARLALPAVLCLVASIVFGSPVGAAEDQATCGGQPVTIYGAVQLVEDPQPVPPQYDYFYSGPVIVGTEGDDVILGTDGAEWIRGLGGDDIICGLHGDDYITGGSGNDRLRGGAGRDHISGSDVNARDVLRGGHGYDYIAVDLRHGSPTQDIDLGAGGGELVPRTVVSLIVVVGPNGEKIPTTVSGDGSGQWWF